LPVCLFICLYASFQLGQRSGGRPHKMSVLARRSFLVIDIVSRFCTVTGTFVPTYFRSRERKFHGWNFRPLELSLPEWKMARNFHSTPCPKIAVATNCTHGEQGSQDVIPCTRPVEACRRSEAILSRSRNRNLSARNCRDFTLLTCASSFFS